MGPSSQTIEKCKSKEHFVTINIKYNSTRIYGLLILLLPPPFHKFNKSDKLNWVNNIDIICTIGNKWVVLIIISNV